MSPDTAGLWLDALLGQKKIKKVFWNLIDSTIGIMDDGISDSFAI
jgi:hypothetical protein